MKRRKNQQINEGVLQQRQNPVAKFAHQFNRFHCFNDKSKYRRNAKHKKQEASLRALLNKTISAVTCSLCCCNENLLQCHIPAKST